jgi:hypothetical protein
MSEDDNQAALDAAQARITTTYAQVEQMLPSVAFENNPLMQAESSSTQQATQLAALDAEVARLAGATEERVVLAEDAPTVAWMHAVQARIRQDIQTVIPLLRDDRRRGAKMGVALQNAGAAPATSPRTNGIQAAQPPATEEQGQLRTIGMTLLRIQDIIAQLVAQLGAPAASMPN